MNEGNMLDEKNVLKEDSSGKDIDLAESVRPAGRFRIYLGSAAGVGKTCAMLDEGYRRFTRGSDVVIGYVETHNRPHTAELIRTLPIVARKKVEHRGSQFEEMDLEAVLERHPEVVLVDELAHTNIPGSGVHEKRWQDVIEILDAGIAVISTVNIQHLESIADAVEYITGVRVAERVPDWVVRKADQIELIDSSPDQLRRRMLHGNIYAKERIADALSGFFKTENLVALRELALRFVADEADEELLNLLGAGLVSEYGSSQMAWDTAERILVAVSGARGAESIIRRAARLAARVKGELLVLHVKPEDDSSGSKAKSPNGQSNAVESLRQLVDDVGGKWFEVVGDSSAEAVVEFARQRQITQIVVGASRRRRIEEIVHGSVLRKILRFAAESGIDVHVIARRDRQVD